jgi:hypothetical protein
MSYGLSGSPTDGCLYGDISQIAHTPAVRLLDAWTRFSAPTVPPTCPTHRFTAVIHGQPRCMAMPSELEDQPVRSGPRVLPKLAVPGVARPARTMPPATRSAVCC